MGATAIGIGLAAATGIWKAKTEYDQNKAAARQAQANADMAYRNAEAKDEQAHEQAQNNALNQDIKRRQMQAKMAEEQNQMASSGLALTGSNARVLADSQYNMALDMGIDAYNGRQKVDNIFQQSTDLQNQGNVYAYQAKQYKKAAKTSLIKNALETGITIAMAGAGGGASKAKDAASAGKEYSLKNWYNNTNTVGIKI